MPLSFENFLLHPELRTFEAYFDNILNERLVNKSHGHLKTWIEIIKQLPTIDTKQINLSSDTIKIGLEADLNSNELETLHQCLKEMMPWRKGPFNFFGISIDTEWRSDWKWQRIAPHLDNLTGRTVLDVGCGSGYHGWRMLGAGANFVLGIDPTLRFKIQHMMCQHYIRSRQFEFFPIGIEDLPPEMNCFDTTFSMGILYHRRNPEQHIKELLDTLKPGGQLVLETLIMDEDYDKVDNGIFVPKDRYAQMRNVWNIPTISYLEDTLTKLGTSEIKCIESNTTSLAEQRRTDWIEGYSLKEFLDPDDISKTIEGYPAPKRATIVATK